MTKKSLLLLCFFLMIIAAVCGNFIKMANANDRLRVVVDAGHGGYGEYFK